MSEIQKRRYQFSVVNTVHRCAQCSVGFKPKRSDRTKFCSRECSFIHLRDNAKGPKPYVPRAPKQLVCKICRSSFAGPAGSIYCSGKCREKADHYRKSPHRRDIAFKCKECGELAAPEYGNKRRMFCSSECLGAAARKAAPRGDDRKRAKHHGVEYQYTNPMKVLRRDGWRCQICKRKTPERLRGSIHPRAPEVDHIVPISKGGPHTYANLQCLCRECNAAKGDTTFGQLNLWCVAA